MTNGAYDDVAREAALRLGGDMPAGFGEAVEGALHVPLEANAAPKSFDAATVIALGGLLVSIAQLAWTIYKDMKATTPKPDREALSRRVRLTLEEEGQLGDARSRRMIEVVVDEVMQRDP